MFLPIYLIKQNLLQCALAQTLHFQMPIPTTCTVLSVKPKGSLFDCSSILVQELGARASPTLREFFLKALF